jgi:hypothetical protein
MGKGSKRRPGSNYAENFEKIFGKNKKAVTARKVYDRRNSASRSGVAIIEDIKPFKSPITGEIISSRSQLRQHHKEHGTTDARDYSANFFEKKQREREDAIRGRRASDRQDRINILREQFNR